MRRVIPLFAVSALTPAMAQSFGSVLSEPTANLTEAPMQVVEPGQADFADLIHPGRLQSPVEGNLRIENPGESYIVNGEDVDEGVYPEVVYLSIGGGSSCTGSLISSEYVLTAAHCVDKITVDSSGILIRDELVSTSAITAHFTNRFGSGGEAVVSSHAVIHPTWLVPGGPLYEGDIALIKLSESLEDRPKMPLNEEVLTSDNLGDPIQFVGFGITEWQGGGGGVKRKNLERIVSLSQSRPYLLNSFDAEGAQSTCQGDSGGPGVLLQCGGYVQATVTSHGPQCGAGPSGHMRVDHYLGWIRQYEPDIQTRAANSPTFQCSHRLNPEETNTVALGVAPFQLNCALEYSTCPKEDPSDVEGDIVQVEWSWGDGSQSDVIEASTGDVFRASHRYERDGRFSVKMAATYIQGGAETTKELTRFGYVRSCGAPEVSFSVEKDDGLTYAFFNETNISDAYGCVFGTQWDIFEGDSPSGTPIVSLKTWEPRYTFDSPGTYTAVLNVGGFTGTVASRATFDVSASRGRESAGGCNTSGSPLGVLGSLAVLGLLGVRRRQR